MKNSLARFVALFLVFNLFASLMLAPRLVYAADAPADAASPPTDATAPTQFTDLMQDDPIFEDAVWLIKEGLLFGFNDNTFKPQEEITRAFLVAVLVNINRIPVQENYQGYFDDLPKDLWATKAIEGAVAAGYLPADQITFRPHEAIPESEARDMIKLFNKIGRLSKVTNQPLTRERLVKFLMSIDTIKDRREKARDVEVVASFGDDKSKKLRTAIFIRDAINKFIEGNAIGAKEDIEYAYAIQPKDPQIVSIRNMVKGDPSVAQADNLKIDFSSSKDLVTKKLNEALYHFYNNRYDEVINECQSVIQVDPNNTTALLRMGSAYYMIKDYGNAKLAWEKILRIDPNHAEAQVFLSEINKLVGQ